MEELSPMLNGLNQVFRRVGLKMNFGKTLVLNGNSDFEVVDADVCTTSRSQEVSHRIQLGCAAFEKFFNVFLSDIP